MKSARNFLSYPLINSYTHPRIHTHACTNQHDLITSFAEVKRRCRHCL